MPTVLIMGGGWGLMAEEDEFFTHMTRWRDEVQRIPHRHQRKSREAMLADPRFVHPNIRLLGFTREISKLMDASDLLVTKPGGMTCTEGMSKGIPMLFYKPIPGQEEENVEHFISSGFGEMLSSREGIDKWFSLIREPYKSDQYRRSLMTKVASNMILRNAPAPSCD